MSKPKSTHEKPAKPGEVGERPKGTPQESGREIEATQRKRGQLSHRRPYDLTTAAISSPFSFMRRFSEEMDRLFGDFGLSPTIGETLMSRGEGLGMWSPQVEIFEREGKLVVRADLPGLKREDITVDVDEGAITIQGERRQSHEENREGFYRSERSYGNFYRSIPLPEGANADDARASFRDGVLEIEVDVPKRTTRGRRIEIQEGTEAK